MISLKIGGYMEHFKVSVTIGNFSIEVSSHDKDWVEAKIKEYDLEKLIKTRPDKVLQSTPKIATSSVEATANINPSMTIGEFYRKYVKDKKIVSRPDIVTFFVYYMAKFQKNEQITLGDVKNCFKEIGYPSWNSINISDSLLKAKKKALLNSFNDLWMLTITGEDYVLNTISE
jgi:hypothetical protein